MKAERREIASAALQVLTVVNNKEVTYDVLLKVYNDYMQLYKSFLKQQSPELMQLQINKFQLPREIEEAAKGLKEECLEKDLYSKLSDLKVYELKEMSRMDSELKSMINRTETETMLINDLEKVVKRYEKKKRISKKVAVKAISMLLQ